jgi:peptidoglycan/xylan/chitin deacetylase (PgdA/CDA1 family)
VAHSDLTRRRFLTGSAVVAAEAALLAVGSGRALARPRPPVTTVPAMPGRAAMTELLPPLPAYIRSGPNSRARVAITVDDIFGNDAADSLNTLLDVAKAKKVKLSIFPTGGALQGHLDSGKQAVWQRVVQEGHDIGNHTYTHANLTRLTDAQVRDELGKTRDVLTRVLGPVPYKMRMMRPPGGAGGYAEGGDPRIQRINAEFGYSMVMWTIDSNGTGGNASLADRVVNTSQNGSVALFHFTTFSVGNYESMFERLRAQRKLEPTNVTGLFGS